MDLVIRHASEGAHAWANERYAEIDFVPATVADQIVVAWLGPERPGVGRIAPTGPGSGLLGGMFVAPHARGRGVADGTLHGNYERRGFRRIEPPDDLPEAVAKKLAYYDRPGTLLRWDRG